MTTRLATSFLKVASNWFRLLLFWARLRKEGSAICFPFVADGRVIRDHRRVRIGSGVRISARAHLALIDGGELIIGHGTSIGTDLVLGSQTRVEIGSKVLIAARCFINDSYHSYRDIALPIIDQPLSEALPVIIEDESWIGINVCIMPGVTVGRHSVVGANSVVTKDVPPYSVVCGAPAMVIRKYDPSVSEWAPVPKSAPQHIHKEVRKL